MNRRLPPHMRKHAAPYTIIGTYLPPRNRASIIGRDILEVIAHYDLTPLNDPKNGPQETSIWCHIPRHAEVRRFAQSGGQGAQWHQDGDLAQGSRMDHAAVLWSTSHPTQFKTPDGALWQPEPYEIVIALNLACHHRTPPDAPKAPTRRWFFRQRVEVPQWLM